MYTALGLVGVAAICFAIRWALNSVGALPTLRMLLLFATGCCLSLSLGAWIVQGFAWFRDWGTSAVPAKLAGLIVAVPFCVVAVTAIFFGYHLPKKRTPKSRDEWSAFILPLAFAIGIGGALGAVGDSIRKGTSDTVVNIATFAVVDTHAKKTHRP